MNPFEMAIRPKYYYLPFIQLSFPAPNAHGHMPPALTGAARVFILPIHVVESGRRVPLVMASLP